MNYELATKLKNAGFPLSHIWFKQGNEENNWEQTLISPPNLSELIEACEDNIRAINFDPDYDMPYRWTACGYIPDGLGSVLFGTDRVATPEEAVSMFWIELNKE